MIQLSFTKDHSTPTAVWFDEDFEDKPTEYHHHFFNYQYYTEKEALDILDDDCISSDTKRAIKDAFNFGE